MGCIEEAMQMEKRSNWQKDLEKLLVVLGWACVKGTELESGSGKLKHKNNRSYE